MPRLTVANAHASAQVYLHGAHVTAWQPAGRGPVLWMSRHSQWADGKPIRGGVPICFPWFGPHAADRTAPGHGYARLADWTLIQARDDERGDTTLAFQLSQPAPPWRLWPHPFVAIYRVSVGASLGLAFEVRNEGTGPASFEAALHTYFAVQDVREVGISGLEHVDYLDKVGGTARKTQGAEPIRFTAETDRIYLNTQGPCTIHDPGGRRRIVVRKTGSDATVVWNPWVDKSRAMPDFGDLEWPEMVCVETCNVGAHAVTLEPAGHHTMTATLDVETA